MNEAINTSEQASIQRVVCFKFKNETSTETIQAHIDGFDALKNTIYPTT
ncbi:antibiotic biosynthesis monooxygenase family protein [Flavobacterium akiainvivens]|nr:Dabb family protein [Flavobacterium akiainvivens]SFQ76446.1 hypothetical protein SAMN05444144_12336 [Flavobacterium akiainvivens]